PPALDITGVKVAYVDLEGAGSSTHLELALRLAAAPSGAYHAYIGYGPDAPASLDLAANVAGGGAVSWSGLKGLSARSEVRGNEVRFFAPIDSLRKAPTDAQKLAAADWISVSVAASSSAGADYAPDRGPQRFPSF